ncbi:hypothetical protein [Methylomagnum sp.]
MSGPTPITPPERMETPGPAPQSSKSDLDWLDDDGHDEPEWTPPPHIPTPIAAPDAEALGGEPGESAAGSGRGRVLVLGAPALAMILALGYFAPWPDSEPRSAARDAEQTAPPEARQDRPDPAPAVAPPVAEPPPPTPESSESSAPVETAAVPLPLPEEPPADSPGPAPNPKADPGRAAGDASHAVEREPAAAPPESPRPEPATAEALVRIAQTLETQGALIERLERGNQVLSDRLAGLEVHVETAQTARARTRSASELPPLTTQPQARLTQRRGREDAPPLPFYIEGVDTWNGEPRVVVRADGRLIDLKPGDSQGDWRIKTAQGQTVTLLSPDGRERTVTAGPGSGLENEH